MVNRHLHFTSKQLEQKKEWKKLTRIITVAYNGAYKSIGKHVIT